MYLVRVAIWLQTVKNGLELCSDGYICMEVRREVRGFKLIVGQKQTPRLITRTKTLATIPCIHSIHYSAPAREDICHILYRGRRAAANRKTTIYRNNSRKSFTNQWGDLRKIPFTKKNQSYEPENQHDFTSTEKTTAKVAQKILYVVFLYAGFRF